jgi:hypothetical protein
LQDFKNYLNKIIKYHGMIFFFLRTRNIKDKAMPLQAWTGPEGSRRLGLPDFKTFGT